MNHKIPELRRSEITNIIFERKRATVKELAASFDVSDETIRRDINMLYSRGCLVKVHGGAVSPDIPGLGTFERRVSQLADEKVLIAKAARTLFRPGDSLMIDAGSTTISFAQVMATYKPLTVITNSLEVARIFWGAGKGHSVILLGGAILLDIEETLGEIALQQISQFTVDHAVLTVSGISEIGQIMRHRIDEVIIGRAMVKSAKALTILADHTKINNSALMPICEMAQVNNFVTDKYPPDQFVKLLEKVGVNLVVAQEDNR